MAMKGTTKKTSVHSNAGVTLAQPMREVEANSLRLDHLGPEILHLLVEVFRRAG